MHRLRWKLCQMWGVPVNSPLFEDINETQWLWYLLNYLKDEEESFEKERNLLEYQISFMEPEGVSRVRKARDGNGEGKIGVSDEQFKKNIESLFKKEDPMLKKAKPEDYEYWQNKLKE